MQHKELTTKINEYKLICSDLKQKGDLVLNKMIQDNNIIIAENAHLKHDTVTFQMDL